MKLPAKFFETDDVRGWLHEAETPSGEALAITHGAGSNGDAPLLRSIASEFCAAGYTVLRFDLPYRRARPHGPPFPSQAPRDREGIRKAVEAVREIANGRVFLGGHSYGGRQSTMVAAEDLALADGLLLLSYPLHPPGKAQQLRTEHFDKLRAPALFAHGTRDPFGSPEEMRAAIAAIPARTELLIVEGAAHGLPPGSAKKVLEQWTRFIA